MDTSLRALPELLELLYEVLVYPERWRDFLSELCRHITCNVAVSFHDRENRAPLTRISLGIPNEVVEEWNTYYGARNPRSPNFVRAVHQRGFMLFAGSLSDASEAVQDTEYGQWQRRRDLCHLIVAAVSTGLETFASVNLIRPQSAGTFGLEGVELVRMLIPHLQHVFQIQEKLETLHAYSEAGKLALDRLDAAFMAVDALGRVVLMSDQAEAILRTGHGLTVRDGRLAATDSSQAGQLEDLVKAAARAGAGAGGGSAGTILVQGDKTSEPVAVTATPFGSANFVIEGRPCALVFLSDPKAKPASRTALLRTVFGLTPTECRLAQLLLEGLDMGAASQQLRVTAATARFMLKRIFNKTACHRQSQLIRLLSLLPGERKIDKPERPAAGFVIP
jgi:DNA-binding CsgD family transcriptional regulator